MKHGSLAEEKPELIVQWSPSNALSPYNVSSGSHKKVLWICSKGHTWKAEIKNRVFLGSGCPYCNHRATLKGFNDFQTLHPGISKEWSPKNPILPYEVGPYSNRIVIWKCKKGHEWKSRVADRTNGHGCPYCNNKKITSIVWNKTSFY